MSAINCPHAAVVTEAALVACPICGTSNPVRWLRTPDRFYRRETIYRLLRCRNCRLGWVENPPKPDEIAFHYSSQYHSAVAEAGDTDVLRRWKVHRETLSRLNTRGALLDIGCSSGGFFRALDGQDWELHGIEFDPQVAQRAKAATGAQIFVGDALAATFLPESFDVVTCFHVLEHQYQPVRLAFKVWEWLKPGGFFHLIVPNIDAWEARIFGPYWYALEAPRHLYHFSCASVRRLAQLAKFRVVSLETHPASCVEPSSKYVVDALRHRLGWSAVPLAEAPAPCLAWRIVRKGLRTTLVSGFGRLAAFTGNGASISVLLQKPLDNSSRTRNA